MTVKNTAIKQYRKLLDSAARGARGLPQQQGRWLRLVRQALSMSGPQLARRLGVTRAAIYQAERKEAEGGITLKKMQDTAEAMGCRFVYAIVPETNVEEIIAVQAHKKARELAERTNMHMSLEKQAITKSVLTRRKNDLAAKLARDLPADFWD